jgi:tetratricopeptide (TPR) repeat protein
MPGFNKNQIIAAVCLLLALITTVLYWPMTGHDFIDLDDGGYITENPHVQSGLTWAGVIWAFRNSQQAAFWHPITWISHMADCQLYGMNPGGHHLTSLLFHVANTLLLFLVLNEMTGGLWRSAFVAALFAWHPIHVESVAWAAERKDVLSTFFWLLTMMAYVQYVRKPRRLRYYSLALLLFALGLMSKPMVVTLPCVLLLIDFWPLGRFRFGGLGPVEGISASNAENVSPRCSVAPVPAKSAAMLICEKLPFFALMLAGSVVTYLAQKAGGAVWLLPFQVRIANALMSYVRYISKILWPANLAAMYPYSDHWPVGLVIAAALLLAVGSLLFIFRAKQHPYLITGWFWYLGTLVPAIGLVQVGHQAMADRFVYIPSIGLFIIIVWALDDFSSRHPFKRVVFVAGGVAILMACLVCARSQLRYWRDSETLFRHTIGITTDNYVAYSCLGKGISDPRRSDEAMSWFAESVRVRPSYLEGQYNLGTLLLERGRLDEAVSHLAVAVHDNPRSARGQNNLGKALQQQGKLDEAAAHLSRAVALDPDNPEAHYNFGTLLLLQSKTGEAVAQFTEALRLKTDYADAEGNIAVALMNQGKAADAIAHFSEAARLAPHNAEARFNLGLALLDQNKPEAAAWQFSEALRLKPDDVRFHYRLAVALARQHKSKEAIPRYREALRLMPDFPEALDELAWILASDPNSELRSGKEAVQLAERACELTRHEQAPALITLAAAYAEAGRFAEAVASVQTARDLALKAGQKEEGAKAEEMLELFKSGRPFHEAF